MPSRSAAGTRDVASIRGQRFRGEIEKLRGAMESMVGMLDRRYDELQESKSELARYRDSLEELVLQRKRQLEEATAELVHAERMAALGQVAATVGHELRNPLGTVKNALFSLGESLDGAQAARVRRSLELAQRNIQRCDRIISELLEYAKKRAPRMEPTTLDTWLAGVLDECMVPGAIEVRRALDSGVDPSRGPRDPEAGRGERGHQRGAGDGRRGRVGSANGRGDARARPTR